MTRTVLTLSAALAVSLLGLGVLGARYVATSREAAYAHHVLYDGFRNACWDIFLVRDRPEPVAISLFRRPCKELGYWGRSEPRYGLPDREDLCPWCVHTYRPHMPVLDPYRDLPPDPPCPPIIRIPSRPSRPGPSQP